MSIANMLMSQELNANGGCIDFSNLTSTKVVCRYGYYDDPDYITGVINYGSSSISSRHTVHTDTSERDIRTGNLLRCIDSGDVCSVRLGNWGAGAQAESITYEITVDTQLYDLLIMRYSAVMEDPGHPYYEQPRFTFRVMDSTGNDIYEDCYSADFVASSFLGWNTSYYYGTVLWKDWTTVGVDLDPLHGQTIYLKLTTYDCDQGGHYGYAYFSLKCGNKVITSTNCGDVLQNDFMAPAGFTYKWYRDSVPDSILSTTRVLTVDEEGVFKCDLNFVGAASDDCSFTMTAVSGPRYPYADFEYSIIGDSNCVTYCEFMNKSVIVSDTSNSEVISPRCETYLWDFGDGTTSEAVNPIHTYSPGVYQVTLYAMIANGGCVDTLTMMLSVIDSSKVESQWDTVVENQLPWLYGNSIFSDSVSNDSIVLVDGRGCDSLVIYSLFVYRNINQEYDTTVCDNYLPVEYDGHLFQEAGTYEYSLTGIHGEDSVVVYHVFVNATNETYYSECIAENLLPWYFVGQSYNSSVENEPVVLVNTIGCDSTVYYSLFLNSVVQIMDTIVENQLPWLFGGELFYDTVRNDSTIYEDRHGCDSLVIYNLFVYRNINQEYDTTVCDNYLPVEYDGHLFQEAGTYEYSLTGIHGEDSVVVYHVFVNATNEVYVMDSVVENQLPWSYHGNSFDGEVDSVPFVLTNRMGCDSTVVYSLTVFPNIVVLYDTIVCNNSFPVEWRDCVFYESGTIQRKMVGRHGEDSTMMLTLLSMKRPHASLRLDPERVNFDNREVRISDHSEFSISQEWYVDGNYYGTGWYFNYDYPVNEDSVEVTLLAYNDIHCVDTAKGTIYMDRGIVWAANAFTPEESSNNTWCVKYDELVNAECTIYTRQGQFVTEFNIKEECWDGRVGGRVVPQGSYVWIVRYSTKEAPRVTQIIKGTVTVLR